MPTSRLSRSSSAEVHNDENLAKAFAAVHGNFATHLSKVIKKDSVSYVQFTLLEILAKNPDSLSMTEISDIMAHTNAATTGLVDRLEKLGYVRRKPDKDDRRKILVGLTNKAASLFGAVEKEVMATMARIMISMGEDEKRALLSGYQKILALWNPDKAASA